MRKKILISAIFSLTILAFFSGAAGAKEAMEPPVRYDFTAVQDTAAAEGVTVYTPMHVGSGWLYELAGGGYLEARVGTLLFDEGALTEQYIDIKGANGEVRLFQNSFAAGEAYNKTQFWSFKKQAGAAIVKGADAGETKCVTLFELPDGTRYIYGYIDGDGTNFWSLELKPEDCYTQSPYNFIVREDSVQTMRVEFKGNQMYHQGHYVGFGVSGLPMLSLQYLAGEFGYEMRKDAQTGVYVVEQVNLSYSFRVKPGSNLAEICYDGRNIGEYELFGKPILRNGVLYLYSLDIRELLGMTSVWDNEARTWDVSYRDYTVYQNAFPGEVNDDVLLLTCLATSPGGYEYPFLTVKNTDKDAYYGASGHSLTPGADGLNRFEMNSSAYLPDELNNLEAGLTVGQRILSYSPLAVRRNIEDKEIKIQPPYQLTNPARGYIKTSDAQILVSGSVAEPAKAYTEELVLFVKNPDSGVTIQQISISVVDGQFTYDLKLTDPGLYKITLTSVMAAPRGLAYPEITYFYADYQIYEE